MNVFDKKRKIYNSNEHNSNNNVAKCHILINYWCREYGIDYSSYNRHNNSYIYVLDSNSIKGVARMTGKLIVFLLCAFIGCGALISVIMTKDYKQPSELYNEIEKEFWK